MSLSDDLRAAFKMIDSVPMRMDTVLIHPEDYADFVNWAVCGECGASHDKRVGGHPGPGCDVEKVRDVMES